MDTPPIEEGLTQDPDTIIAKLLTVPSARGGGGSEIRMLNVAHKATRDDLENGMRTSGFQEEGRDDPITWGGAGFEGLLLVRMMKKRWWY